MEKQITVTKIKDCLSDSYYVYKENIWIGNMHKIKNNQVEVYPRNSKGSEIFNNPYDAMYYIEKNYYIWNNKNEK